MNIKQEILRKIDELGADAPKWFGYAQKTLDSWKKKPNSIPLKAVEKVLNDQRDQPRNEPQTGEQTPLAQSSDQVAQPQGNPAPTQNEAQPRQPYTIEKAEADIAGIVNHFNAKLVPIIGQTKNQGEVNANAIKSINDQLRELAQWKANLDRIVPSQQEHAQTVGQLLASQPSDQFNQLANPNDLPSRLRPGSNAQVIAEFNPEQQPNGGHNLDTGIAPTAEDRSRSLNALAQREDPRNPRRPAGPAQPQLQNAPGMTDWARPWPTKR